MPRASLHPPEKVGAKSLSIQWGQHGPSFLPSVVRGPALGEAEFDMSVSANMASVLMKVLSQGGTPVDYRLKGRIALSSGLWRSIPFDERLR